MFMKTGQKSIKNNVHDPLQDQRGRVWIPQNRFKPPSDVISIRSKAVVLVRLISSELKVSFNCTGHI